MLYSNKYKYIYYAPQRTGSTTMVKVLKSQYSASIYRGKHAVIYLPQTETYFTFATVREPYIRFLSIWNFLIGRERKWRPFENVINKWRPVSAKLQGFRIDKWIRTDHMEEDFKQLPFSKPDTVFPRLNKSRKFLLGITKKQLKMVKKQFARDFKQYGYDADDVTIPVFNSLEECFNPEDKDIRDWYEKAGCSQGPKRSRRSRSRMLPM